MANRLQTSGALHRDHIWGDPYEGWKVVTIEALVPVFENCPILYRSLLRILR